MKKNLVKKLIFTSSLILCTVISSAVVCADMNHAQVVSAYDDYTIDDFVVCENWYYSGKGFELDFTFDPSQITSTSQNTFSLMSDTADKRITTYNHLTFNPNGEVTSSVGKVIKRDNCYTLMVMFKDFTINTDGGANGTETVKKMSFRWVNVQIQKVDVKLIDTLMYLDAKASIRDETTDLVHGLMFNAYMPRLVSGSKYGMAIVPNEYLGNLTNNYTESLRSQSKSFVETYCTPIEIKSGDEYYTKYGAGYYIKATLGNIKTANIMRDFSAIPFEETSSGVRKYAFNINEEKDNLYNTCYRALKAGNLTTNAREFANDIVSNINNRTASYSTTNIKGYIADPNAQILKNADFTSSLTTLNFKAAKDESEGNQVILTTSSSGNKKIFASVSNLVNGDNVIENSNIEVKYELYQNIATNWSISQEHYNARKNLYPNGYETLALGYYPNALMPMDTAVRSGSNLISPTNGHNQGLYIKIKVPANAQAGTYTGKLIIYVLDEGLITIPVSLEVVNFSLEGRNDANTMGNISRSELNGLYGDRSLYNNLKSKFFVSAIDFMKEYGLSGGIVPEYCRTFEQLPSYVKAVKKYLDGGRTKSYLINYNAKTVDLTWTYKTSLTKTKSVSLSEDIVMSDAQGETCGLKDILTALVNASTNDCDLLAGACIYDPHADEPSTDNKYIRNILNYNSIRKSVDYVATNCDFTGKDKVAQSLQKLTYIVTCGPENSKFVGSYGIQNLKSIADVSANAEYCSCSQTSDITYKVLKEYCPNIMWNCDNTTKSGSGYCWDTLKKVYNGTDTETRAWEYTCIQPIAPYPSYIVNAPSIRTRANRWRQFGLGVQGEFYYMFNRTNDYMGGVEYQFTEEQILYDGARFEGAYGDGSLMFPVHDTFGYTNKNLYWFPSLRMEIISEGVDDLNTLYYAKELINSSSSPSTYMSQLTTIIKTLCNDEYHPTSITASNDILMTARNNLLSLIINLLA